MIGCAEAQALLEPIQPRLVRSIQASVTQWTRFVSEHPDLAVPLQPTCQWQFIHDHVQYEVTKAFDGDSFARPNTKMLQMFGLLVDEHVFLRFKHLSNGLPRAYPTDQQKLLAGQEWPAEAIKRLEEEQGHLFALPTFLTCGYTMDGAEVGRIEIRRDWKFRQPWSFDIFGGVEIYDPLVFPGQEETAEPARVTRRTDEDEDTGHGEVDAHTVS